MRRSKRMLRPRCRGIEPEGTTNGYYCLTCGYSLLPTPSGWWRHGDQWIAPEVWTRTNRAAVR